ncbi:lysosomal proton-coupled steroid conjugate and bile acid symporter SLC46A3-like [Cherax quadricarinatus]
MDESEDLHSRKCSETTPLISGKGSTWPELPTWTRPSRPLLPTPATLRQRLAYVVNNVTVEPIMFLNIFAWTLQTTLVTNMVLEKVCADRYNHTEAECQNLTTEVATEATMEAGSEGMQRDTAWVMMMQEIVASLPAVVYVLLLGSWSDTHGRKLPMLLSFTGSFIATIVYMMNAFWWWLPVEDILVAGVARGLTGGSITLLMATYSYISDLSDHTSRTLRIAFLDFAMFIGAPVGLFLSCVIFSSLGYLGVFSVSGLAFLVAIIYILFYIEDTKSSSISDNNNLPDLPLGKDVCSSQLRDIFDVRNVMRSLAVAVRRRENYGRAKILSLMTALCLLLFTSGSNQLEYLYAKRMLGWTYLQYAQLNIFDIVFGSVGTSLVLPVLSYWLGVQDTVLAVVGCLSKTSGFLFTGLGNTATLMYMASVVSFLAGLPLIVTRAVISKLVPAEETGAVFSLLAALEAVVPLISCPTYTLTYAATLDLYPGTMYFLSAIATTMAAFIYTIISFCDR